MAFITNITTSFATSPTTGVYGEDGLPLGVDNNHGNIRDAGTIAETGLFSSSAVGEGNPITTIISGASNRKRGRSRRNKQNPSR